MIAVQYVVRYKDSLKKKDLNLAILLFGLSLSIKHTLIIFVLWSIYHPLELKDRLKLVFFPIGLFLVQFLPFMLYSKRDFQSIASSVFKYWSSNNAPFWKFWFWDKDFAESLGNFHAWHHGRLWMFLMFTALLVTGFFVRNQSLPIQFAIFTIALLIFASAITSQFLAIPAIGAAVFFNFGFGFFYVLSALFLFGDPAGLGYLHVFDFILVRGWNAWNTAPFLLIVGVARLVIVRIFAKVRSNSTTIKS